MISSKLDNYEERIHLTCRDYNAPSPHHLISRKLVEELQTRSEYEHQALLQRPREVLQYQDHLDTTASNLFSPLVRTIHRKLLLMERQCLSASFIVQTTEFGQFEEEEERFLYSCCQEAVHTLEQAVKAFRQLVPSDREAMQ